ncbi:VOC family protein [Propylenella binzhouense]|uniref:Glyoxalase/bleomycin resistance/extradiol dioxygenase family protein n=1 Tax=Propylenella binzhouense TaxID=2555902 RepID=A0A964T431_9HYPH|nr:VOC family protein [Propylenella binzhouense]MYZ47157.1 glyoxalase/bleomycin resistance/extradiol dioxygenase family protein [Propylenella binzhouense]
MAARPKTFRLAYLDFVSDDLQKECEFYTNVVGLIRTESGNASEAFLTLGYDHHNISIRDGSPSGLSAIGYQLAAEVSLNDVDRLLRDHGLRPTRKRDERPGVSDLLEVEAVPGHTVHFFSDMDAPAPGFSERGIAPIRLGHVAVLTQQAGKLNTFYRELLGFYPTDTLGAAQFYTCNHDHHVLNIIDVPSAAPRVHHVAFELRDYAAHARASDVLATHNYPVLWGPTRHTSGHNISSYFFDTQRKLLELYAQMDVYWPDLDMMEPRPWHLQSPMRPQVRAPGDDANWKTVFKFGLSQG